jgi:hypothetical protein
VGMERGIGNGLERGRGTTVKSAKSILADFLAGTTEDCRVVAGWMEMVDACVAEEREACTKRALAFVHKHGAGAGWTARDLCDAILAKGPSKTVGEKLREQLQELGVPMDDAPPDTEN